MNIVHCPVCDFIYYRIGNPEPVYCAGTPLRTHPTLTMGPLGAACDGYVLKIEGWR